MAHVPPRIAAARSQFPSLTRPGSPVYLDNPGGTQVPQAVVDAMAQYLLNDNSNTHGAFATSERTDRVIEAAHEAMADFLGASGSDEVAFGPNMTTLTFAVSRALGREFQPGDEVVVTNLDHDANVAPWLLLAEDRGLTVRVVDIHPEDCTLDMDGFPAALSERTRLVAFTHASNAVGTVNDVRRLTELAHQAGAFVYIDAVHYGPHGPLDVQAIGCDFLACSPYKFFGPHAGVVYIRRDHSERLRAYKVRPADDSPPYKWETGTQSHEAMAGTVAAVDYLASLAPEGEYATRRERLVAAMTAVQEYERELSRLFLEGIERLPVRLYGLRDQLNSRVPTFAITADGFTPRQLAEELGKRNYNVWDGNYYALALMERLGLEESGGAVRIGMAHYNTPQEVEALLHDLGDILSTGAAVAAGMEESAEYTSQG